VRREVVEFTLFAVAVSIERVEYGYPRGDDERVREAI